MKEGLHRGRCEGTISCRVEDYWIAVMVLVDGKSVWSGVRTEECWIMVGAWVVCWIVMKTLENDDTLLDTLEAKDVVGITRVDEVGNAKECILV